MYKLKTNKMKTQLEDYELYYLKEAVKSDLKEFDQTMFDNPNEVFEMLHQILEKLQLQEIDLQIK